MMLRTKLGVLLVWNDGEEPGKSNINSSLPFHNFMLHLILQIDLGGGVIPTKRSSR